MKKILFILFILFIGFQSEGQKIEKLGYLVSAQNREKGYGKIHKVYDPAVVDQLAKLNLGIDINTAKELTGTNLYFIKENSRGEMYCERKVIIRKQNGKLKWKRITKKYFSGSNREQIVRLLSAQ